MVGRLVGWLAGRLEVGRLVGRLEVGRLVDRLEVARWLAGWLVFLVDRLVG